MTEVHLPPLYFHPPPQDIHPPPPLKKNYASYYMIWGYHVAASTLKIILFNFCIGQLLIVFAGSQKGSH